MKNSMAWDATENASAPSREPAVATGMGGGNYEFGFLLVLSLPFVAAMASFENVGLGGVNYLVFVTLLLPLVLAYITLVTSSLVPGRLRAWPGHAVWLLWYAVIWLSLFWGIHDTDAIKHAFEMSTPYLFGIAGAVMIQTESQLKTLLTAIGLALFASLGCVLIWKVGVVEMHEFGSDPALALRPHSMSLMPIGALGLALFTKRLTVAIILWGVCVLLTGVEGSRGVTLCLLVLPLFHPQLKGLHWKLLAMLMIGLMGLAIFHLPSMQERLFPDTGSGTIADLFTSKQSGMGRFDAWPIILDEATQTPLLGHGVSSAFHFVPTIWPGMRSPHNELLCISYELGIFGLAAYFAAMITQITLVRRAACQTDGILQTAFVTVFLSLIAVNFMGLTDNPLSSNVRLLNPVFLLMGAAFAVKDRHASFSLGGKSTSPSSTDFMRNYASD